MDSNVSFKRMTALIIAGLFYRVVHFRINLSEQRSLGLVAAWLVIVNIFALLALNRLNLTPDTALDWMSPETYKPVQNWNIIDLHNRWDSFWYLNIATNGYQLWGENNQSNVVFFPLYPMLLAALKPFCGGNPVLAGWMVSSFFLVLSAVTLTRLTKEFHPDISDPLLPTTFMLVYPTAFYLNAVYSESVFLFFSLAAVLATLRKNFAMGALWVALASFSFTSKFKRLLGVVSTRTPIFLISAIIRIWPIPCLKFFLRRHRSRSA
jgi:Gpi18-like mannosyltransferase